MAPFCKENYLQSNRKEGQEGGRASALMSRVTFAPRAHIDTWLTGADKMEALDKPGQSGLSEGVGGHPASATDHSVDLSVGGRRRLRWLERQEHAEKSSPAEIQFLLLQ